jgi:hypothetical protein
MEEGPAAMAESERPLANFENPTHTSRPNTEAAGQGRWHLPDNFAGPKTRPTWSVHGYYPKALCGTQTEPSGTRPRAPPRVEGRRAVGRPAREPRYEADLQINSKGRVL